MNKEFVLIFRMHNQLVDFVTFKFFLFYLEKVVYIQVSLSDIYIPDTDVATGISNK